MKTWGYSKKSIINYEDDQIVIPVAEANCFNIAPLIEHATMDSFYSLDEFANLYKALGHEFGMGHLNSTETVLILNLFDIKLSNRIQALPMPNDSRNTEKVLLDEWWKIRHNYIKAEIQAKLCLVSKKYVPIFSCMPIKHFEFPRTFSSK